jgi:hypothetical protein
MLSLTAKNVNAALELALRKENSITWGVLA